AQHHHDGLGAVVGVKPPDRLDLDTHHDVIRIFRFGMELIRFGMELISFGQMPIGSSYHIHGANNPLIFSNKNGRYMISFAYNYAPVRYRRSRTGADRRPARAVGFRALLIVAGGRDSRRFIPRSMDMKAISPPPGPGRTTRGHGWKNVGLPWSFRLDKAKMYKINNEG
ncbi:MAG: hypothetical protein KGK16_15950, partial [Bradyrhizobium sp.]|nr:hypothetical protein [Bradyrhizobium sp.]